MTVEDLRTSPTPLEVATLIEAVRPGLSPAGFSLLRRLAFDWERLRDGLLTPAEFDKLCHNSHLRPCTRAEFEAGCDSFQTRLFGPREPVMDLDFVVKFQNTFSHRGISVRETVGVNRAGEYKLVWQRIGATVLSESRGVSTKSFGNEWPTDSVSFQPDPGDADPGSLFRGPAAAGARADVSKMFEVRYRDDLGPASASSIT